MGGHTPDLAARLCDDAAARVIAGEQDAPAFFDSSPEVQDYWVAIARAAEPIALQAHADAMAAALRPFTVNAARGAHEGWWIFCTDADLDAAHAAIAKAVQP